MVYNENRKGVAGRSEESVKIFNWLWLLQPLGRRQFGLATGLEVNAVYVCICTVDVYYYLHVTSALDGDDDDAHALPSHAALKIGTRPAVQPIDLLAVTFPPLSPPFQAWGLNCFLPSSANPPCYVYMSPFVVKR